MAEPAGEPRPVDLYGSGSAGLGPYRLGWLAGRLAGWLVAAFGSVQTCLMQRSFPAQSALRVHDSPTVDGLGGFGFAHSSTSALT